MRKYSYTALLLLLITIEEETPQHETKHFVH